MRLQPAYVLLFLLSFLSFVSFAQQDQAFSGAYMNRANSSEVLHLNPDGTFALTEEGRNYTGTWKIKGTVLTLTIGGRRVRASVVGETFVDAQNKYWVKQQPPSTTSNSQKNAPAAHTAFANADVIQLTNAGMPDDVIIQKIRTCNCELDTSTPALIQLRQAGVSSAVMTAMMGGAGPVLTSSTLSSRDYEREPDFSSPYYNNSNEYHVNGYGGQCTWFAWGRAYEKGFALPFTNEKDGKQWHGYAMHWADPSHLTSTVSTTPRADSIAVWSKNGVLQDGHVAYVEALEGDQVFYREANIKPCSDMQSKKGGGYCGDGSVPNKGLRKHPLNWFMNRFGEAPKFIYLARNTQPNSAAMPAPSAPTVASNTAPSPSAVSTKSTPYRSEHLAQDRAEAAALLTFNTQIRPRMRGQLPPNTGLAVIGVMEMPAQNTAVADLRLTNVQTRTEVGLCRFDLGKATFQRYNDGRWVLTHFQLITPNIMCAGPGIDVNVPVN